MSKLLDFDYLNPLLEKFYRRFSYINFYLVFGLFILFLSEVICSIWNIPKIKYQDDMVIIAAVIIILDSLFFKSMLFRNDISREVYTIGVNIVTNKDWYLHNYMLYNKRSTTYNAGGDILSYKKAFRITPDSGVEYLGNYGRGLNPSESKFLYYAIKIRLLNDEGVNWTFNNIIDDSYTINSIYRKNTDDTQNNTSYR